MDWAGESHAHTNFRQRLNTKQTKGLICSIRDIHKLYQKQILPAGNVNQDGKEGWLWLDILPTFPPNSPLYTTELGVGSALEIPNRFTNSKAITTEA